MRGLGPDHGAGTFNIGVASGMTACPACGAEVATDARFCSSCGAPLEAAPAASADGRNEERRVVATLFCDLVGFTALCEGADPEDVDSVLRGFFALARGIIEEHGGTVEKFIGDAVVGVFGVPAVHEDDSQRAVLAALRIRERLGEISSVGDHPLQIRCGVNTGTTLVRLHIRPDSGEGLLVGDAVNTAARLQQAAPPGGIAVGDTTKRLTEAGFLYDHLGEVRLKGKRETQSMWLLRSRVARAPAGLDATFATPLVDRGRELASLRDTITAAHDSGMPQFVLLVGEAGIGKSRLVAELARWLDRQAGMSVRWRQGSCPPYGTHLSHWPMSEIVKAHAGILETDGGDQAEAKLRRALSGATDADRLVERLRPLLGLPSSPATDEVNYAAWRHFLESLAGTQPAVVVFEDLHWADRGTLDFLAHLTSACADVPLVVVATARPEFVRDHGEWGSGGLPVRILRVGALNDEQGSELVERLFDARPSRRLSSFVGARCGGNALFTQELVRHLKERHLVRRAGLAMTLSDEAEAEIPDSLQTLIAARLDVLDTAHKAELANAAVVGRTFWLGAVAAVGQHSEDDAREALDELVAREFVRAQRDSALADQQQFAFWHTLTHEVAYGQLTRAARCAKHARTARWIEQVSGTQPGDVSEVLAHHYVTALDLAQAIRDAVLIDELRQPTAHALRQAGARAMALEVPLAVRHYQRALDILADDDPQRPYLLIDLAEALLETGRSADADAALEEAAMRLSAAGDEQAATAATRGRWYSQLLLGRTAEDDGDSPLPASRRPTPALVDFLHNEASLAVHKGLYKRALDVTTEALRIAVGLRLPTPSGVLATRGSARCGLGDAEGLRDVEEAQRLAREQGSAHKELAIASNRGELLLLFRGPRAAMEVHRPALELGRQRHDDLAECFCREVLFIDDVWAGDWDGALARAPRLVKLLGDRDDVWDLMMVRSTLALLLAWRGESDRAVDHADWAERQSRDTGVLGCRQSALVATARLKRDHGDDVEAVRLLEACAESCASALALETPVRIPEAVRTALSLERDSLARHLADALVPGRGVDVATLEYVDGLLLERHGRLPEGAARLGAAADIWDELGVPYEAGQSRLAEGRCALALGDVTAARMALHAARERFARLGAAPALAEADERLGALD